MIEKIFESPDGSKTVYELDLMIFLLYTGLVA